MNNFAMNNFERWSVERLHRGARCVVEPSMSCIPLRADEICRRCHEAHGAAEGTDESAAGPLMEDR